MNWFILILKEITHVIDQAELWLKRLKDQLIKNAYQFRDTTIRLIIDSAVADIITIKRRITSINKLEASME